MKTKSDSEAKMRKEGRIFEEDMDLGGSHLCGRGFCSMGPNPAALLCFLLPFPGLSQPGLFSATSILSCFFPVPRLGRRDLSSQQGAWKGANISLFWVCPFCIFVVTSQRQENWPATPCGSSFPYLSCCSAQACSGGAECCGQVDEMIPWHRYGLSRSVQQTLLKSVKR